MTHDQREALALADRLAVMSEGRIEQVGPPEQVYRTPASEFVARFVGNSNLLPVVVLDVRDGRATVEFAGSVRNVLARADAQKGRAWLVVRPESTRISRLGGDGVTGRVVDIAFRVPDFRI